MIIHQGYIASIQNGKPANYKILVHRIDGGVLATMYRNGVFIHYSEWTPEEQHYAAQMIEIATRPAEEE